MKKVILLFLLFLMSYYTQAQSKNLKAGTVVILKTQSEISSKRTKGTMIKLDIEDIVATSIDSVFISSGIGLAYCDIEIKPAAGLGKSAVIILTPRYVQAVDGRQIPLKKEGRLYTEAPRNDATIALSFVIPIVGGFLVKGKEVIIPKGTLIEAQIAQNVRINL